MSTVFEPNAQYLGSKIEEAMRTRELKPTRLAAELDVSESTLRRFIAGDTDPSFRQIVRLSQLLGYPLDWFVGEAAA